MEAEASLVKPYQYLPALNCWPWLANGRMTIPAAIIPSFTIKFWVCIRLATQSPQWSPVSFRSRLLPWSCTHGSPPPGQVWLCTASWAGQSRRMCSSVWDPTPHLSLWATLSQFRWHGRVWDLMPHVHLSLWATLTQPRWLSSLQWPVLSLNRIV